MLQYGMVTVETAVRTSAGVALECLKAYPAVDSDLRRNFVRVLSPAFVTLAGIKMFFPEVEITGRRIGTMCEMFPFMYFVNNYCDMVPGLNKVLWRSQVKSLSRLSLRRELTRRMNGSMDRFIEDRPEMEVYAKRFQSELIFLMQIRNRPEFQENGVIGLLELENVVFQAFCLSVFPSLTDLFKGEELSVEAMTERYAVFGLSGVDSQRVDSRLAGMFLLQMACKVRDDADTPLIDRMLGVPSFNEAVRSPDEMIKDYLCAAGQHGSPVVIRATYELLRWTLKTKGALLGLLPDTRTYVEWDGSSSDLFLRDKLLSNGILGWMYSDPFFSGEF